MAREVMFQVSMDAELKEQAELLYKKLGMSFSEAIQMFLRKSIENNAMPFAVHVSDVQKKRKLGIANGKYRIPDNIDECNDEIAEMFGVDEK